MRTPTSAYSRILRRLHSALKAVWEPSPPEPLDDHRTLGQLRYSAGFTRRRLGPRSDPVVRRMRQLTGELSRLRREVDLLCAPVHGDYKLGNAVEPSVAQAADIAALLVTPLLIDRHAARLPSSPASASPLNEQLSEPGQTARQHTLTSAEGARNAR